MDGTSASRLGTFERLFLLVPLAGGAVFGVFPYLALEPVSRALGYSGDDVYVYRIAGAATFGYAIALGLGLARGEWPPLRHVVLATYVFNAVSFLAALVELAAGRLTLVAGLILVTALFISWSTARILVDRRGTVSGGRDIANWTMWITALAIAGALFFGLAAQVAPAFASLLGYRGSDEIVYRLGGAATLGYAAMGVSELRSPRWEELRLPTIMGIVFNGLAFLASLVELAGGRLTLPVVAIGPASLAFSAAFVIILLRRGR